LRTGIVRRSLGVMKRIVFLLLAGLFFSAGRLGGAPAPTPDDDKMGTIAGTAIQRSVGDGWLGLELKDSTFVLTFYNAKKKPVAADKSGAAMRWPVHYQPNDERTELLPTGDPAVLASDYTVRPPYSFKLHITLLGGDPNAVESYVIDFGG
jgi:hypothetical protein